MKRRTFSAAAAALMARPGVVLAKARPRIVIVLPTTPKALAEAPSFATRYVAAFEAGLKDRGWLQGRDVEIVVRGGAPRDDHGDAIDAARREGVDVLVLWGNVPVQHAMRTAPNVPVAAFLHFGLKSGIAQSLARPGLNVTGVAIEQAGVAAKRLALLKEAAGVRRVARVYYWGPYRIGSITEMIPEYQDAARALNLEVFPLFAGQADGLRQGMEELAAGRGRAGISTQMGPGSPVWPVFMEEVRRHRIPVIYDRDISVQAGGLMSYGDDWDDRFRKLAHAVDRVLRGTPPGDIPIEQPSTFDLVLNLDAAREIGLAVPPSVQLQANRVIEGGR